MSVSNGYDFPSQFHELLALFEQAEVNESDTITIDCNATAVEETSNYFFDQTTRQYWLEKKEVEIVKHGKRIDFLPNCSREWKIHNTVDPYKTTRNDNRN